MKRAYLYTTVGVLLVTVSVFILPAGCFAQSGGPAAAKPQIISATPPMGWNSWNYFGPDVNERIVRETTDALVTYGFKDAGYVYMTIDDVWQGGRDQDGNIYPNPKTFPGGIKSLADYVHSKGLKFGIYTCAGEYTCNKKTSRFGHEKADAKTFAEWGVDFVKDDYCWAPDDYKEAAKRYTAMGDALKATGRPIVYSICEWGVLSPWLWARQAGGNMWRISYDVGDMWDNPRNVASCIGILTAIDVMANIERYAGPGGWNDPDMLVIGLDNKGFIKGGGCTDTEYKTQMNMWSMFSAPLIMGGDVRSMRPAARDILLNLEVIAIDQDPAGKQAFRVARTGCTDTYKKPLADGRIAVGLLNRGRQPANMRVSWQELELDAQTRCQVRDVWSHTDLGESSASFSAEVAPHECKVVVMTPETKAK